MISGTVKYEIIRFFLLVSGVKKQFCHFYSNSGDGKSTQITLQVKVLHTNCTHYAEKAPFKVSYFHKYCWNVITDFIC